QVTVKSSAHQRHPEVPGRPGSTQWYRPPGPGPESRYKGGHKMDLARTLDNGGSKQRDRSSVQDRQSPDGEAAESGCLDHPEREKTGSHSVPLFGRLSAG